MGAVGGCGGDEEEGLGEAPVAEAGGQGGVELDHLLFDSMWFFFACGMKVLGWRVVVDRYDLNVVCESPRFVRIAGGRME